jgi:hypothetical protein
MDGRGGDPLLPYASEELGQYDGVKPGGVGNDVGKQVQPPPVDSDRPGGTPVDPFLKQECLRNLAERLGYDLRAHLLFQSPPRYCVFRKTFIYWVWRARQDSNLRPAA